MILKLAVTWTRHWTTLDDTGELIDSAEKSDEHNEHGNLMQRVGKVPETKALEFSTLGGKKSSRHGVDTGWDWKANGKGKRRWRRSC